MQVVMIGANACGDEVLLASDNAMRMMMIHIHTEWYPKTVIFSIAYVGVRTNLQFE